MHRLWRGKGRNLLQRELTSVALVNAEPTDAAEASFAVAERGCVCVPTNLTFAAS